MPTSLSEPTSPPTTAMTAIEMPTIAPVLLACGGPEAQSGSLGLAARGGMGLD